MMKQNVDVRVTTQVFQDNGDERYDIQAPGTVTSRGMSLYLTYTESLPDQPDTKVLVKFKENQVTITRKSAIKTHLVFRIGLVDNQPYQTAAGMMILATNTSQLNMQVVGNKAEGQIQMAYSLSANGSVIGQYLVSLQFGPKSSILS
ncbi:DUF1934 domain-containing protein [Fructobacillus ficulneus]|uniref:DUF1934 domain-containing protein n=1 Tax=Fructobacillus ficulneus TaxID=157463 RepID=A0A0K8MGJ7_9LACO|nr:DUF1934 domain-containing protein [Fructobacillus ficulneus]GAO99587.1 hypothetical protein FFIC_230710 [Fructobacillus ficulneus]